MADTESLKDKNLAPLTVYVAAHGIALAWISLRTPLQVEAAKTISALEWGKAAAFFAAAVVTVLLNSLLSPHQKAVLVFWRRRHPLPGTRFDELVMHDARIDPARLQERVGKFPGGPKERNWLWDRIYRKYEPHPSVRANHRDFLLLRDLTCVTFLLTIFAGGGALALTHAGRAACVYAAGGVVLYLAFKHAAAQAGERFVTTVLACEASAAEPPKSADG